MKIQDKIFLNFSDWHLACVKHTSFGAIKWDGTYRPFKLGDKDVFVYGMGRKKISKNYIVVPVIDGNTNLSEYFEKYGSDCAFYSLTSRQIGSNDCCYFQLQCEFTAMIHVGIDKWISYMKFLHALKENVNSIYISKYGIVADNEKMQNTKMGNIVFRDNLFTIRPSHYLMYPFRSLPHFNPIEDDKKLISTYVNCELGGDWEKWNSFGDDGEEQSIFPSSVKDRITYLFGSDVCAEYERLMHPF